MKFKNSVCPLKVEAIVGLIIWLKTDRSERFQDFNSRNLDLLASRIYGSGGSEIENFLDRLRDSACVFIGPAVNKTEGDSRVSEYLSDNSVFVSGCLKSLSNGALIKEKRLTRNMDEMRIKLH